MSKTLSRNNLLDIISKKYFSNVKHEISYSLEVKFQAQTIDQCLVLAK